MNKNRDFYNAAGVVEENLPFSRRSSYLFSRIEAECREVIFPGCTVLEIGCGNGRFSFELEKMGAVPTGIDVAGEIVAFANDFAVKIRSGAEFYEMNACDMSGLKRRFDVIFLAQNNIVEFSEDDFSRVCGQAEKLLKKDGKFFIEFVPGEGEYREIKSAVNIPGKGEYCYTTYIWNLRTLTCILQKYFGKITRRDKGGEKRCILTAEQPFR